MPHDHFEWQDSYNTGVRRFDLAHRGLLDALNELLAACHEDRPIDDVTAIILDLIRKTYHHFRDEEEAMRKSGYEGFAAHRASHDALFDQFFEFAEHFAKGRIAKKEIPEFLMAWLVTHIVNEDGKYRDFFISRNFV